MKKYLIIIVSVLLIVALQACNDKDFLKLENQNFPSTDVFWKTASDAEQGLIATYSALQYRYVMGGDGMSYREVMSDLAESSNFNADLISVKSLNWKNDLSFINDMWSQLYIGVFRANQVIEFVPKIDMPDAQKTRILAEARFLRGLYYHWLAISYNNGSVPLVTSVPTNPDQIYNKLASKADVYKVIIDDLTFAKINLPNNWKAGSVGRATSGAASAFLGQISLYEKNYTAAANYFSEVIGCANCSTLGAKYKLVDSIGYNFDLSHEFNSESVFEVAFSGQVQPGASSTDYDGPGGSEATSRALRFSKDGFAAFARPSGFLGEVMYFDSLDFSKPINTGRKMSLRAQQSLAFRAGDIYPFYGQPNPFNTPGWGNHPYKTSYRKYSNSNTLTKEDVIYSRSGINERVMRLSDVYLMYAECLVQLNESSLLQPISSTANPIYWLNLVRARAGVVLKSNVIDPNDTSPSAGDFVLNTKARFMNYLMFYERPRELCAEGFGIRFQDLRRWGILRKAYSRLADTKWQLFNSDANITGGVRFSSYDSGNPSSAQNFNFELPVRTAKENFNENVNQFLPIPNLEITSNKLLGN